jgi:putative chitinase
MTTIITKEQFSKIFPRNKTPDEWSSALDYTLFEFGIIEPEDVAMFLAQCGHESADFTTVVENLNYSSEGLLRVFPRHFRDKNDADRYHRKPEQIANRVYQNRMGNGPESSGDGWKFRGRGILQVTGRSNYSRCSRYLYGDEKVLLDDPDILLERRDGILAALWFWDVNKLKGNHNIEQVTRIINGGHNGLNHRKELYQKSINVLK